MIKKLDQDTRKRVNKAIANIRLMATRVKRAKILDATQKAEVVVNLLNEFRQYVNTWGESAEIALLAQSPNAARNLFERVRDAIAEADAVFDLLPRVRQKSYSEEHTQVWSLLEDIQRYLYDVLNHVGENG